MKDVEGVCSNTVALVTSLVIALASSDREQTQVSYSQHNHHISDSHRVRIQVFFKLSSSKFHRRFLLCSRSILKSSFRHWPPNSSALHQVSRAALQRERSSRPIWRSSKQSRRKRRRRSCNLRASWMRLSSPSGSWRSRWRKRVKKETQFSGGGTHLSISGSADRWGRDWWPGVKY